MDVRSLLFPWLVCVWAAAQPQVYPAGVEPGLPAAMRLYPITDPAPMVKVRDPGDPHFGFDVKIQSGSEGLRFDLTVRDATRNAAVEGVSMWVSDSVQLALDIDPETPKPGYSDTCYELGFALADSGKVLTYAWYSGRSTQFDFSKVRTDGRRIDGGYCLAITIPWANLGVDSKKIPRRIGVNLLVNDSGAGHRQIEWTPGIGTIKAPGEFTQIVFPETGSPAVVRVLPDRSNYEDTDWILGRFNEFALASLPTQTRTLYAVDSAGRKIALANLALPPVPTGSTRQITFRLAAGRLQPQGRYRLLVEPGTAQISADISRFNYKTETAALLEKHRKRFAILSKADPRILADPYVTLGLTVADHFLCRLGRKDLDTLQAVNWTWLQVTELTEVLDRTEAAVRKIQADPAYSAAIPFPQAGSTVTIRDGVICANGKPFYFLGYTAFETGDFPLQRKMGCTLHQIEAAPIWAFGPDRKFTHDGQLIRRRLDDGTKCGAWVDLTTSPHWMPVWAQTESPDMKIEDPLAGFVKFYIDHPKAREVTREWLEALLANVKDHPALFSVMFSNEPQYSYSGRDPHSKPLWLEFLKRRHGTIAKLNGLYQTNYKDFSAVPVPAVGMPEKTTARRAYYDWVEFNREHYTDWHRWMRDVIKKAAPNVLVHAKPMSCAIFEQARLHEGVDPEALCKMSDLAGNDGFGYWPGGTWAYDWQRQEIWYDALHAFRDQPVFNSEFHVIQDGDNRPIPPAHTRAIVWQGLLHHLAAACLWVWGEGTKGTAFEGDLYMRPANMFAAGRIMLDANRLASELTRVNRAPPDVAILLTLNSLFWEADYSTALFQTYTALSFLGQNVTFVTERQLAAGKFPDCDTVVVPHATHVTRTTVDALACFVRDGKRLIRIGGDCLAWDEYHRSHTLPKELAPSPILVLTGGETLARELRNLGLKILDLRERPGTRPAWGVEFRAVRDGHRTIVPLINFLPHPQTVRLAFPEKVKAADILNREPVDVNQFILEPMVPRLLELTPHP